MWHRLRILLSTLLFTLPITTDGGQQGIDSDRRLEQLYSQAKTAQDAGDYSTAARNYAELLKLRPGLAEVHANLGMMRHLQGEYAEAVQSFEATLRLKPDLFGPNLLLGLDLLQLNQPKRAVAYLQHAQRLNSKDVRSALGLGQAYVGLQDFARANDWYRHAAKIDPANAEAWYGLGITYLGLSRGAGEQIEKVGRGSVYGRILYAESLEARGAVHDAVIVYEKLVAMPAAPPWSHAALGFAYLMQGKPAGVSEAVKQFTDALKANPGCLLAQLGLARADIEQGNTRGALDRLGGAWRVDARFVRSNADRLWRGLAEPVLLDFEERLKEAPSDQGDPALGRFLTNAIERWRADQVDTYVWALDSTDGRPQPGKSSPSSGPGLTADQLFLKGQYTRCAEKLNLRRRQVPAADLPLLAECAYNSGDYRTSFEAGEELLRSNSSGLPGLYWRSKSSQKLGIMALFRAGLADPNSPRMHILLGEAYRERNNFREAETEFKKAIEIDPNNAACHLGLAMVDWHSDQVDKAIPELQRVLALKPGDPEASYAMGAILVEQDQYEHAMPYLTAALAGTTSILPHVHALRGRVFAERGQLREAVTEFQQALERDLDGSYHYQLSTLYRKLGDKQAAATALQESERIRAARKGLGETPDAAR